MRIPDENCYRSLLFDEQEEYTEYIGALTDKLAAGSADYVSLNNRGLAQYELGNLAQALEDLTAACHLTAHDTTPFLNRASVLLKMGDFPAALEAASQAIDMEPAACSGYFVRASIYTECGDQGRADEDTQTANKYKAA